jgi:hypothetical protein
LIRQLYNDNKPLFYSFLTGLLYFLFCWSIDFGDESKMLFSILMMFLPGVTFPLATCYFDLNNRDERGARKYSHFILSVAIYHGSVWLFSGEGRIKYVTMLAGFTGSLLFLLTTKYLLKKKITWGQILVIALISGLSFLPYEVLINKPGLWLGIAVFSWTIVNGQLLNFAYRKSQQLLPAGKNEGRQLDGETTPDLLNQV